MKQGASSRNDGGDRTRNKRQDSGRVILFLTALALFVAGPSLVSAEDDAPGPFTGMGGNFLESLGGANSAFWLSGIAATVMFSNFGVDRAVHDYFSSGGGSDALASPAPLVGFSLPLLLGGGLYFGGLAGDATKPVAAGSAVLQASFLALLSTSALKAVTGRPPPSETEDNSRDFRFGVLRGGIFWGWPSGHMATNTAAVVSFLRVYDDNPVLDAAGGLYLGWLFYGVVSHQGATMHWFSDAVAGTLIGYAIGSAVGDGFKHGRTQQARRSSAPVIRPLASLNYAGLWVSY